MSPDPAAPRTSAADPAELDRGVATSGAELRERRIQSMLRRELGFVITQLLEDPTVTDIGVNADGHVWFDAFDRGLVDLEDRVEPRNVESALATIATYLGTRITADSPILNAELPFDGSRISGILPPITTAPTITLRKRAARIFTLDDYAEAGVIRPAHLSAVREALRRHDNILVSGNTGAGKTTFINALLQEMVATEPNLRFFLAEDVRELQCPARNVQALRTSPPEVLLRHLIHQAMREKPDRIIVGEVRGAEALEMLKAWTTHRGGAATIHGETPLLALLRLDNAAQEAGVPSQSFLISMTVHMIVQIERVDGRRQVTRVARLAGREKDGSYRLEEGEPPEVF
ncbi:MAG: P-type conjugative transfer ATPase TrbB [Thermoanaerobaculia bacterium]|nr:P-type conjugative transfer ATPase TrbB [Thermoanaerobaculia bacterium]